MVGEGQKDSGTVTSGEVERLDAWMLVRALLRKTEDPRKRVPGRGIKDKSFEAEMCLEGLNNCKEVSVAVVEQGKSKFK